MKLRQYGLITLLIITIITSYRPEPPVTLAMSPWGQEREPGLQTFGQKGNNLVRLRPAGRTGGAEFYLSQMRSSLLPVDWLQTERTLGPPLAALARIEGSLESQGYRLIVPEGSAFDPALPWLWEYVELVEFSVVTGQYIEEIKRQITIQEVLTYPPDSPDGLTSLLNLQNRWLQANPGGRFWIEALLSQEADNRVGIVLFSLQQPALLCETIPPAPPGTTCAISDGSQAGPIRVFRLTGQPLPEQERARLEQLRTEQQRQEGIILVREAASNEFACYLERGECFYWQNWWSSPELRCERDPLEHLGITCMVLEKPGAETVQFFTIAPPLTPEEKERLSQMSAEEQLVQGIQIVKYFGGNNFVCFSASGECRFLDQLGFIPAGGDRERHTCSWFASLLGLC